VRSVFSGARENFGGSAGNVFFEDTGGRTGAGIRHVVMGPLYSQRHIQIISKSRWQHTSPLVLCPSSVRHETFLSSISLFLSLRGFNTSHVIIRANYPHSALNHNVHWPQQSQTTPQSTFTTEHKPSGIVPLKKFLLKSK